MTSSSILTKMWVIWSKRSLATQHPNILDNTLICMGTDEKRYCCGKTTTRTRDIYSKPMKRKSKVQAHVGVLLKKGGQCNNMTQELQNEVSGRKLTDGSVTCKIIRMTIITYDLTN